jgi:hypothetical protein
MASRSRDPGAAILQIDKEPIDRVFLARKGAKPPVFEPTLNQGPSR